MPDGRDYVIKGLAQRMEENAPEAWDNFKFNLSDITDPSFDAVGTQDLNQSPNHPMVAVKEMYEVVDILLDRLKDPTEEQLDLKEWWKELMEHLDKLIAHTMDKANQSKNTQEAKRLLAYKRLRK